MIPINVAKAVPIHQALSGLTGGGPAGLQKAGAVKDGSSFADILKGYVNEVGKMEKDADKLISGVASGDVTDVHQVMMAVEEANMALDLLVSIRNKLLEAYQELARSAM